MGSITVYWPVAAAAAFLILILLCAACATRSMIALLCCPFNMVLVLLYCPFNTIKNGCSHLNKWLCGANRANQVLPFD